MQSQLDICVKSIEREMTKLEEELAYLGNQADMDWTETIVELGDTGNLLNRLLTIHQVWLGNLDAD